MLLESLAGLATRAVNGGRWDESIWYDIGSPEYAAWKKAAVSRLRLKDQEESDLWALLARYHEAGLVKGYVLYRYDSGKRELLRLEPPADESINVATVVGALSGGVLVCEELEERVKAMGLRRLFDARDKDEGWCLERYGDQLSRRFVLAQDPRVPNLRSLVYATPMMVVFGVDEVTDAAYRRLSAPGTILGWNSGDELAQVTQMSRHGHVLVPANWSTNVAVLSAAVEDASFPGPVRTLDPNKIDFTDARPTISFVLSDGDNLQWMMGDFFHASNYWGAAGTARDTVNFGVCLGALQQAAPDLYAHLVKTQPNSTVVQMCAGYFYPDLLAGERPAERKRILTEHARRLNHYLKRTGCRVIEFICMDWDGPAAREAYDILACELETIVGILVVQYAPYHAGEGEVIWAKGRDGQETPVLSCRYSLWAHLDLPGAGSPNKIARLVKADADAAASTGQPYHHWVVAHAWSGFRDRDAESPEEHARMREEGSSTGVLPVAWTARKLNGRVRVVSIEEAIWRLRMHHAPRQTAELIKRLKP